MRRRLVTGFGAIGGGFVLVSAAHLLAVPLFVSAWGVGLYGEWLAIQAAAALLTLVDGGLQVHLTNLMRVAAARDDRAGLLRVLHAGFGLYAVLVVTGVTLVVCFVLLGDVTDRLGMTAPGAPLAALLMGSTTVALLPRGLLGCVFSARGQLPREVALGAATQLVPLAGVLVVAAAGGGLAGAAAAHALLSVAVGWGVLAWALRRWHPDVVPGVRWPGRLELRGYIWRSTLHGVAGGAATLALHLPILLLQAIVPGSAAVVVFSTMRTFAGLLKQAVSQAAVANAVEMVRLHAQGDASRVRTLLLGGGRVFGGGAGLAASIMLMIGPPFFVIWTRGAVTFDPWLAGLLIGGVVAATPGTVAVALLRHTDHAEALLWPHVAQVVVLTSFASLLAGPMGPLGVAGAVVAADLVALSGPAMVAAGRAYGFAPSRLLLNSWGAALLGGAFGGGVAFAMNRMMALSTLPDLFVFAFLWSAIVAPPALALLAPADLRRRMLRGLRRAR